MSYTVIEDIVENPLSSQYKTQQSNNTKMWPESKSMRSDFANNPQYDPKYSKYAETSPMPMDYGENTIKERSIPQDMENNNKRTKISQVMNLPRTETPLPTTTTDPEIVTNLDIKNAIKVMALNMETSVKFFAQKTRKMEEKLLMIDQILKGIGIILLLLLIFMMIKK
jgi:hypothetical protein